jgi:uncharacterized protein YdcH (DUF465 family)
MDIDDEIVSKLEKENVEFKKMKELHGEYEHQIEEYKKKHYLSDNERIEVSKLKKKKLAAKDRMYAIIKQYKS